MKSRRGATRRRARPPTRRLPPLSSLALAREAYLNQIHQCAVAVDAAAGADAIGLAPLPDALAAAAGDAWLAQRRPRRCVLVPARRRFHLAHMGEKHEEEAVCAGYRVDLLIPSPVGIDDDAHRAAASGGVAVEVDGPSHFARNDARPSRSDRRRLKHRQLRGLGFAGCPWRRTGNSWRAARRRWSISGKGWHTPRRSRRRRRGRRRINATHASIHADAN